MSFFNPAFILSILLALSFHEWAHGYVAYKLGDPTAKYEGRLTLNPLAHLDPIGTILFLTVGFGWGKPVPINPRYFRHYKRDTALVSIAGPASNLLLALVAFAGLALLSTHAIGSSVFKMIDAGGLSATLPQFLVDFLTASVGLNLGLMAFNLLPIAPLDGSKILAAFVPYQYEEELRQFLHYGPFILLFLLLSERFLGVNILFAWIDMITEPILKLMQAVVGG